MGCSSQRSKPGAKGDSKAAVSSALIDKDAGCSKQRGLVSGNKQGQPRVKITRQVRRDEAGLRSSQEVNKSDQVRISKVHGQPQAQPQSS